MPPSRELNKDFWKQLFIDEKKLFKINEINSIIVPKIDELKVPAIIEMIRDDKDVRAYLPNGYFMKVKPDRTFLFNIINTVYPGFLKNLIDGACK